MCARAYLFHHADKSFQHTSGVTWRSSGKSRTNRSITRLWRPVDFRLRGNVGRRPRPPNAPRKHLVPTHDIHMCIHVYSFFATESRASTVGASECNPISRDSLSREQSVRLRMRHRSNASIVCTHLALIYDGKTQL